MAGDRPAEDAGRPAILLVSGSSTVRTPAALNHAIYAERHGLRVVFDVTPAPVHPITMHKLAVLRRHLPTADWSFWIDDDAFFTDLDVDLRSLLPADPSIDLVFCASPVNPEGGWTWMSSGQFLIRNTARMADLLAAVEATDLDAVRASWDHAELGLFTNGDQDAFAHHLRRDGSPWAGAFERRPWEAFNARPYHYRQGLDEWFICHFAVPGGKSKMALIREFAARLGTTTALVDPAELTPYRTFIDRSPMGALLAPEAGPMTPTAAPAGASARPTKAGGGRVHPARRAVRRTLRAIRRRLGG